MVFLLLRATACGLVTVAPPRFGGTRSDGV
jgi:hypothetical protein